MTVALFQDSVQVWGADGPQTRARADYLEFCAGCHGKGGSGDGPLARGLRPHAADLTKITERNAGVFDENRVRSMIDGRVEVKAHGRRDMPVWGEVFQVPTRGSEGSESIVRDRIIRLVALIREMQANSPDAEKR